MTLVLLLCIFCTSLVPNAQNGERWFLREKAQIPAGLCSSQNCDGELPSQMQCFGTSVPGSAYHENMIAVISAVQIETPLGTWTLLPEQEVFLGRGSLMYSEKCNAFYSSLSNVSGQPLLGEVCLIRSSYPPLPGAEGDTFCTPSPKRLVMDSGKGYWDHQTQMRESGGMLFSPLGGVGAVPAAFLLSFSLQDPYDDKRVVLRYARSSCASNNTILGDNQAGRIQVFFPSHRVAKEEIPL